MTKELPHNFWCKDCGGVVFGKTTDHNHRKNQRGSK